MFITNFINKWLKATLLRCFVFSVSCIVLSACVSINPSQQSDPLIAQPEKLSVVASTQISPALLKEELRLIRQKLMDIHPQPFARVSQKVFEQKYRQVEVQLNRAMSRGEFFLKVAPLLSSLNDVHTFLALPKDLQGNYRFDDESLFPIAVIVKDSQIYVAADLSESPYLASGAEIRSINRIKSTEILAKMREFVVKETLPGQDKRIQMDFARLLATLGLAKKNYDIEFQNNGKLETVTISGITNPFNDNSGSPSTSSFYGYSKIGEHASLLWLNDFNETPEVFDAFLADKFNEMERDGVSSLIIDLRYNGGGLSQNLKSLLARVANKPAYWAKSGEIKVSEVLQAHHKSKTRKRRQNKLAWGFQWLPIEWVNELQRSIWWSDPGKNISLKLEPVPPSRNKSLDSVWVLTNGYCYSACSFFVAAVNYYQFGETVGELPGSYAHFQFGYPVEVTLPHSLLKLALPTMRLNFVDQTNEKVIIPKKEISREIDDIRLKRDPALNYVLEKIQVKHRR